MNMIYDAAIIGAGPSGLSAAMQLKRAGVNLVIFEKDTAGGLLRNACLVENYPGFPGGISGNDLADNFLEQSERLGVNILFADVTRIEHNDGLFAISTIKGEFQSRIIVLATGTSPKEYDECAIPDECKHNIFCEIYPIRNVSDKTIAIVGAGDAAFDYALSLSRSNYVSILNRCEKSKCLGLLEDRVKKNPGIEYLVNTEIKGICKSGETLSLKLCMDSFPVELTVDYLVFAIGREPKINYLSENILERISELENSGHLYRIGDMLHGNYRQTAISVGDGILAAMKICEKLRREKI